MIPAGAGLGTALAMTGGPAGMVVGLGGSLLYDGVKYIGETAFDTIDELLTSVDLKEVFKTGIEQAAASGIRQAGNLGTEGAGVVQKWVSQGGAGIKRSANKAIKDLKKMRKIFCNDADMAPSKAQILSFKSYAEHATKFANFLGIRAPTGKVSTRGQIASACEMLEKQIRTAMTGPQFRSMFDMIVRAAKDGVTPSSVADAGTVARSLYDIAQRVDMAGMAQMALAYSDHDNSYVPVNTDEAMVATTSAANTRVIKDIVRMLETCLRPAPLLNGSPVVFNTDGTIFNSNSSIHNAIMDVSAAEMVNYILNNFALGDEVRIIGSAGQPFGPYDNSYEFSNGGTVKYTSTPSSANTEIFMSMSQSALTSPTGDWDQMLTRRDISQCVSTVNAFVDAVPATNTTSRVFTVVALFNKVASDQTGTVVAMEEHRKYYRGDAAKSFYVCDMTVSHTPYQVPIAFTFVIKTGLCSTAANISTKIILTSTMKYDASAPPSYFDMIDGVYRAVDPLEPFTTYLTRMGSSPTTWPYGTLDQVWTNTFPRRLPAARAAVQLFNRLSGTDYATTSGSTNAWVTAFFGSGTDNLRTLLNYVNNGEGLLVSDPLIIRAVPTAISRG